MPFDRLMGQRRILNPSSVGMPYGHPGAGWALLGPDVTLRQTRYDAEAAAEAIRASRYTGAQNWAAEYVLNHYSDAEALEAFTAIAREQAASAG
jgi:diadenosine tetraphosphatase ApaH/serine/threonine PP2A family protein phosphatase